jgi:GTP pyrophosphokinase
MESVSSDFDKFCIQNNVNRQAAEAAGIRWPTLKEICDHHSSRLNELKTAGIVVAEALQPIPSVHSLKMRVKDPAHLAEKIIRKRIKNPEQIIDETN